jgi:hypothetical protein
MGMPTIARTDTTRSDCSFQTPDDSSNAHSLLGEEVQRNDGHNRPESAESGRKLKEDQKKDERENGNDQEPAITKNICQPRNLFLGDFRQIGFF